MPGGILALSGNTGFPIRSGVLHMAHFLNLFSPETHARFSASDKTTSGFRERNRKAAAKIEPGDFLVCYLTRVSRWVGLFRVEEAARDDRPLDFTNWSCVLLPLE